MDELISNPFSTVPGRAQSPYDDESVMGGGARGMVNDFQRADIAAAKHDPLADQEKALTQQKTQLGYAKDAAKQLQKQFLTDHGSVLFSPDEITGEIKVPKDKIPNSDLASQLADQYGKSQEKESGLAAQLTGTAGAATSEAADASAELSQKAPYFKAVHDQWLRIQDQVTKVEKAHSDTEIQLGAIATKRLQATGVLGTPAALQVAPAVPATGMAAPGQPAPAAQPTPAAPAVAAPVTPPSGAPSAAGPAAGAPLVPPAPAGPTPLELVQMHKQMNDNEAVIGMDTTSPQLRQALQQKNDRMNGMFLKSMALLPTDDARQRVVGQIAKNDPQGSPGFFKNLVNAFDASIADASGEMNRMVGSTDADLLRMTREDLGREPTGPEIAAVLMRRTPAAATPSAAPANKTLGDKVSSAVGGLVTPAILTAAGHPTSAAVYMGMGGAGAERKNSQDAGDDPELQKARSDLGFAINTMAGLIPGATIPALSPVRKILAQAATGAAVGYAASAGGDILQQRPINQEGAVTNAILVGLLGSVHAAVDNELQMRDLGQRWSDATGQKFKNNKEAFNDFKQKVEEAVNAKTDAEVKAAKAKDAGATGQPQPAGQPPGPVPAIEQGGGEPGQPAAPAPTTSPEPSQPAPGKPPIANTDGPVVQRWTFTDKAGKQVAVEGTGLKDASDKLPDDFEPDPKKTPTQEAVAAPRHQATPQDLAGETIGKDWTAFSPESKSLGVPRAEMPQIKSEARGALTQFLAAKDITHTQEEVLPGSLKPTQAEYSQAKVEKARNFDGGDRAILVSADNHVVDGHHQWIAALHDEPNQPMRVIRLNAPIKALLPAIAEFPSVKAAAGAIKPSSQSVPSAPGPGVGASTKSQVAAEPAGKPLTQGPDSGAVSPPNPRSGVEAAPVPAPAIARGKNTPAATLAAVTKASGITPGDRAHKFLTGFLGTIGKANKKAFADMEVHVLKQADWDKHPAVGKRTPDSAGAYDPESNTLYLNSDKSKGDAVVNTVVHEAGHFAEKYYLGEDFTQREWEKLSDDQRAQAKMHYTGEHVPPTEGGALKSDRHARSEWVAMQLARVVRGETDTRLMSPQLRAKLERLRDDLRDLVNRWVGSGKLTTTALDAKIIEMMGHKEEQAGPTKKPETSPAASSKPRNAKVDKLADELFGDLLGTPADTFTTRRIAPDSGNIIESVTESEKAPESHEQSERDVKRYEALLRCLS